MTDSQIAEKVAQIFPWRPKEIEDALGLRQPIYRETATYGHMGRKPEIVTKHFHSRYDGDADIVKTVKLFSWEELDKVEEVRKAFAL